MRHYKPASGVHRSIVFVVRGSLRVGRACRPFIERVVDVVVAVVAPGAGESLAPLTRYAVAGGAVAGSLALARAFAGPGLSELIELVAAVSVGVIAVSAALAVTRSYRAKSSRALIVATTKLVAAEHRHLSSTRVLLFVCNPRAVLALGVGPVLQKAVRMAVDALVVRPVLQVVPGLGFGLDAIGACRAGVSSVRFIRHYETAAASLLLDSAA